jgi:hypothetical protein
MAGYSERQDKPVALWTAKVATWTPVAVADTVNFTDLGYFGLIGGTTTQVLKISEVYEGGQASVTSPMIMLFSRDSTIEATPTAFTAAGQSMNSLDPASAALVNPMVAFQASSTKPQRAATLGLLNLSFNAWGGVVCWKSAQGEELLTLGNTASFGEVSLSAYTGGTMGLMGHHVIFEPR